MSAACLLGGSLSTAAAVTPNAGEPQPDGGAAIVSLTFDDGWANQALAGRILQEADLPGTFYVSSGLIGDEERLSWHGVRRLAEQAHEIGGHSLTHPDLVTLPTQEARAEICEDRDVIMEQGYQPLSFSYPLASSNASVRTLPAGCGYLSARDVGGLEDEGQTDLPAVETVPPRDPFRVATPIDDRLDVTLQRLQELVGRVEAAGGWMPLVFHRVCDQCAGDYWVSPDVLTEFATWLSGRAAAGSLQVLPVGEVITGEPLPAIDQAAPQPATVQNPSLEETSPQGVPRCFLSQGFGAREHVDLSSDDARSGTSSAGIEVTAYTDGDQKLVTAQDGGKCAVGVEPGRRYDLTLFSKGQWNDGAAVMPVFVRGEDGRWRFLEEAPATPATDDWRETTYRTQPMPEDVDLLSFGLALRSTGWFLVDDFAIEDVSALASLPRWVWTAGGLLAVGAGFAVLLSVLDRRRSRRVAPASPGGEPQ